MAKLIYLEDYRNTYTYTDEEMDYAEALQEYEASGAYQQPYFTEEELKKLGLL